VQVLAFDGTWIRKFAHSGARDIEVDESGNVYVWGDWILRKYDASGNVVSAFHALNYSTNLNSDNHFAVSRVTTEVVGVNVGGPGFNVWNDGTGSTQYVNADEYSVVRVSKLTGGLLSVFGGLGSEPGTFYRPYNTEFDTLGILHVLDTDAHHVQAFNAGTWVATSPVYFSGSSTSSGFAIDHAGRLYLRNSGTTVDVYHPVDTETTGAITVAYTSHTSGMARYAETWYDADDDALYLFTNSAYSVMVYRLTFTGW
jgi:hypothetical protein